MMRNLSCNRKQDCVGLEQPLLPYVDDSNRNLYEQLGLFENDPLPAGPATSAKILQVLLEKNWKMKETDKDMILMLHEFEYELNQQNHLPERVC